VSRLADLRVREGATLRAVLEVITKNGKQVALVLDEGDRLLGLCTDGDLRRALLRGASLEAKVDEVMNRTPVVAPPGLGAAEALALMRTRGLRHLPLVDGQGTAVDLLRLEELLAPPERLTCPAVVMAGGEGRRLRPLTEDIPKPLLSVGGKPLVEILIERLRQCGIDRMIVSLYHKSDMIRARLGDGARLGVAIDYVEEPRPLGTMGALRLMRDRLGGPFFVVNGDILTKCDFRAMWDFHAAEGRPDLTVGVSIHQVDIPYGEFTLQGSRVTRVEEKPRKEFPVNAGIYLLDPSAIDLIPAEQYFDAPDLIRALLDRGRPVAAYLIREYWLDVGRHHDLDRAAHDIASGLLD
jgi:dTDP-glucose pyrophosphorylase